MTHTLATRPQSATRDSSSGREAGRTAGHGVNLNLNRSAGALHSTRRALA